MGLEEHGQERGRGFGLLDAIDEQRFEPVAEGEFGYFLSLGVAEEVVAFPCAYGVDGYARGLCGEGVVASEGYLVEGEGLPLPFTDIEVGELAELEAEGVFEFGGLVVGAKSECFEVVGHGAVGCG